MKQSEIVVRQGRKFKTGVFKAELAYRIIETVNITRFEIGSYISKSKVDCLIFEGVKVTIK